MRKSDFFKFLLGITLGLMLAALVAFNALLVWVATGPRSLDQLTPYIERALSAEDGGGFNVDIDKTWLVWGGWEHPLDIRARNIRVFDKEGELFSELPEISLGVDLLALPYGQVLPTSISIVKPVISIYQNADKSLSFGQSENKGEPASFASIIEPLVNPKSTSPLRRLHTIEIINADVTVGNEGKGVFFKAPDSNFIIRRAGRGKLSLTSNATMEYENNQTPIKANFILDRKTQRINGTFDFARLQPHVLGALFSDNAYTQILQMPLSGLVHATFDSTGSPIGFDAMIDGGKGVIVSNELADKVPLTSFKLFASATDVMKKITIKDLQINFDTMPFNAQAVITREEAGLGIIATTSASNMSTDAIKLFWPIHISPMTRQWVISNIHDGGITTATARFAIQPGDLDKPSLPKADVDANIAMKDARVRYLPEHPEVRAVNATMHVDGTSLSVAITSASALSDTKITHGDLVIADLTPDNPYIEFSVNADASAKDVVTLLGLPKLDHAKNLNLTADKAKGRVSGTAKLGFYFFAADANGKETDVAFDIKGDLHDVSQAGFMQKFDLQHVTGAMSVNANGINFNGYGKVNEYDLKAADISYLFEPKQGEDDLIFDVSGDGLAAKGSAKLAEGGKDIAKLTASPARLGKTNLANVEYAPIAGGYKIRMQGDTLDVSDHLSGDGDSEFSFENFPALDVVANVKTLIAANGQELKNVDASVLCARNRCSKANVKGELGKKAFAFTITSNGKNRTLDASAGNAGAVLKALNILTSMDGGDLTLNGNYDDSTNDSLLRGTLLIRDYALKDAPVLAKILSVASLTGFFDTLSGKGIGFRKLSAPFTLHDDVITLKDAKTSGPSIGLTAEGTITFPETGFKITGTIVPAYTLNSFAGKVPIIGKILTGGDGEGIFAARYTLKGNAQDPEVRVNPLSMLTPGFLRDLF